MNSHFNSVPKFCHPQVWLAASWPLAVCAIWFNFRRDPISKMNGVRCMFALLLAGALVARAEDKTLTLPDLIQGAQQWAQENIDSNVLNSLPIVDDPAVQKFLRDLQQRFQGDYVVDVAGLRQTARTVLPLLESDEGTRPYAAWLGAQMDYLDVADEIRISIPAPKIETNQPPPPAPNPSPQTERLIWVRKISGRHWSAAAKEYVPQLKPIFAAQKVPPQLVWVAEVESSFDRRAQSPAGAAGLFQLMPETAKRFGLSLWPRDQRFQTEPNATASAQYLKYLFDRFQDWRLALAAYNVGEGAVQKLLDRYKTQSYDDIAGHLPAETQMYVPRVEAVLLQYEGAKLEQLGAPQG
jgi:membrane-bound lytic murein transglycosylase D